jgi:hypothetical protein
MPLLHFLGVTPINTSFSAGFAFLLGEEQSDYDFAINCFKTQVLGDPATDDDTITPEVVITDNEKALKNSLSNILSGIPQLLCYWHVQKNVLTRIQTVWKDQGEDEEKQ